MQAGNTTNEKVLVRQLPCLHHALQFRYGLSAPLQNIKKATRKILMAFETISQKNLNGRLGYAGAIIIIMKLHQFDHDINGCFVIFYTNHFFVLILQVFNLVF